MNRTTIAAALALGALTLGGCQAVGGPASDPGRQVSTTFPAPSPPGKLTIRNEFGRVQVVEADAREVRVTRTVTTVGRTATPPDWSLTGDTLSLKSACGKGFVGICEPAFRVTVPRGTTVKVVSLD